ncbi:MAG: GxxExxY protein [Chlamydiales bacterium]
MNGDLSRKIIDAAVEVHHLLGGPGLLESVYESALCHELGLRGLESKRQMPIPVLYKNVPVREPLFLDILVENRVIIEVKANGIDYPYYQVQLSTYMRLTGKKSGLLINFGKVNIHDGIRSVESAVK